MSRLDATFARVVGMLERHLGQSVTHTDLHGTATVYTSGLVDINEMLGDTQTDRGRVARRKALIQIMADGTKGPSAVVVGETFTVGSDIWEIEEAPDKSGGMWALIVGQTKPKERSGRNYREENG